METDYPSPSDSMSTLSGSPSTSSLASSSSSPPPQSISSSFSTSFSPPLLAPVPLKPTLPSPTSAFNTPLSLPSFAQAFNIPMQSSNRMPSPQHYPGHHQASPPPQPVLPSQSHSPTASLLAPVNALNLPTPSPNFFSSTFIPASPPMPSGNQPFHFHNPYFTMGSTSTNDYPQQQHGQKNESSSSSNSSSNSSNNHAHSLNLNNGSPSNNHPHRERHHAHHHHQPQPHHQQPSHHHSSPNSAGSNIHSLLNLENNRGRFSMTPPPSSVSPVANFGFNQPPPPPLPPQHFFEQNSILKEPAVVQIDSFEEQIDYEEEGLTLDSLRTSKDSVTCSDPEILAVADEFVQRIKAVKTDEGRHYILQSVLSACRIRQLQFVSGLIRPYLQRDFIGKLPTELAVKILTHLDPLSLCRAAVVSRKWRKITNDDSIWRNLAERYHFEYPKDWYMMNKFSWKEFFKCKYRIHLNWFKGGKSHAFTLVGHASGVITCLQFDEHRIITGSDDCTIKMWSTKTGQLIRVLKGHSGGVWALQYQGNILVSGSTDRSLRVWDTETGNSIHKLQGHTSTVRSLQIKGKIAVSGSRDATLRVWDLEQGVCLNILRGHTDSVRCLEIHDDIVVSGSYDCTLMIWDLNTGECLHKLVGHIDKIYSLVFDGNYVVSGSLDRTIRIWNPKNGQCIRVLEGHRQLVGLLQLRKNILVSGNADRTLKIWDVESGECLHTLSGHDSAITCLQFDDTKLLSGSDDGTLKLWDIRTGKFVRNLIEKVEVVWQLQFNETKLVAAIQREAATNIDVFDFNP